MILPIIAILLTIALVLILIDGVMVYRRLDAWVPCTHVKNLWDKWEVEPPPEFTPNYKRPEGNFSFETAGMTHYEATAHQAHIDNCTECDLTNTN